VNEKDQGGWEQVVGEPRKLVEKIQKGEEQKKKAGGKGSKTEQLSSFEECWERSLSRKKSAENVQTGQARKEGWDSIKTNKTQTTTKKREKNSEISENKTIWSKKDSSKSFQKKRSSRRTKEKLTQDQKKRTSPQEFTDRELRPKRKKRRPVAVRLRYERSKGGTQRRVGISTKAHSLNTPSRRKRLWNEDG